MKRLREEELKRMEDSLRLLAEVQVACDEYDHITVQRDGALAAVHEKYSRRQEAATETLAQALATARAAVNATKISESTGVSVPRQRELLDELHDRAE